MSDRIYSFPPVIDDRARVLIAGTAPSVKSLEHGQFYGHPQNFFWRVIYALFGGESPLMPAEASVDAAPGVPPDAEVSPAAALPELYAAQSAAQPAPYTPPDPDYDKRLVFLQENRLALWDVIYSCEREGSLDVNIKKELPNDFPGLLEHYPGISCIAFNGSKAFDTFRKYYGKKPGALPREVALLKLPSTSPIPTKHMRNLNDRVGAWRAIVPFATGR